MPGRVLPQWDWAARAWALRAWHPQAPEQEPWSWGMQAWAQGGIPGPGTQGRPLVKPRAEGADWGCRGQCWEIRAGLWVAVGSSLSPAEKALHLQSRPEAQPEDGGRAPMRPSCGWGQGMFRLATAVHCWKWGPGHGGRRGPVRWPGQACLRRHQAQLPGDWAWRCQWLKESRGRAGSLFIRGQGRPGANVLPTSPAQSKAFWVAPA